MSMGLEPLGFRALGLEPVAAVAGPTAGELAVASQQQGQPSLLLYATEMVSYFLGIIPRPWRRTFA